MGILRRHTEIKQNRLECRTFYEKRTLSVRVNTACIIRKMSKTEYMANFCEVFEGIC